MLLSSHQASGTTLRHRCKFRQPGAPSYDAKVVLACHLTPLGSCALLLCEVGGYLAEAVVVEVAAGTG